MEDAGFSLCCAGVIFVAGVVIFLASFRVVPEHHRLVVFRLGRLIGEKGPGLLCVIPFIDRTVAIDLREIGRRRNALAAATADGIQVEFDLAWSFRVTGPAKNVMTVADTKASFDQRLLMELRDLVGQMTYGDMFHKRAWLLSELRGKMAAIADGWGVELINLDIQVVRKRE
jgi:regulator of protease activity HflC (stomatin/prohibitin superfamily)